MPGSPLQVVIVYNKSNTYGLSKDAKLLSEALVIAGRSGGPRVSGNVKIMDCREAPVACDVCIHLEVPYAVWFPWARTNVMLVNGEWWSDAWAGYMDSFDIVLFRDTETRDRLCGKARHDMLVRWSSRIKVAAPAPQVPARQKSFVYVLGGSQNKRAAAEALLPLWRESYPPLTVYTSEPLSKELKVTANVTIKVGFLEQKVLDAVLSSTAGHICASRAESFGYTAAESEESGAFTILNTLPVYKTHYAISPGIGWLQTPVDRQGFADFSDKDALQAGLDKAIADFEGADFNTIYRRKLALADERSKVFLLHCNTLLHEIGEAFGVRESLPRHMPPLLNPQDCPPISIVTLVHNRPKFAENACLNLLHSDYPREKIEWIVVDDSDPDQSPSNRILQFAERFAPGTVVYVPLAKKKSIGAKRNLGCERASHDIILMMDDDDHYPITSFRRRVAWLLKARKRYECATCTTIAMYDLMKGVSAVNVPPYSLGLAERCSEATLTFTKGFWRARPFADVSRSEGEEFLKGREAKVVEMPPQQILVALSHGGNISGRDMPNSGNGCFWGFSRPLLEFLHGLVGVKVEEEKA